MNLTDDKDDFDWKEDDFEEEDDFSWEEDDFEEEDEEFSWEEDDFPQTEEDDFDWSFVEEKEKAEEETEVLAEQDAQGEDLLSSLFGGEKEAAEEEEPAQEVGYLPMPQDNKKARLDITKNSKEDHRTPMRFTKKEVEAQLKKDLKYFKDRCKSKLVVKPFFVMEAYPYKKKSSDSDIMDSKNVDEDYILVIGRLPKLRGTEEFKGKAYLKGRLTYLPEGQYDQGYLKRHMGLLIDKKYKRIKKSTIRKLLDPIKNQMRNGWPLEIYKELPQKEELS
ncbi:hypothetical protein SapgrDRAFT_1890 [Saprospira grandis DSM 2844]|uniref:Uncharacterized protein n=1 Tax=Saprospira grandis DSM 2844 TaxID=694433 RepID=J0P7T1_9BACT|nr:hypothetical protein [Saprospira grandis]EJF53582.1 hypothetical protein SapgrDRAFT_1890 [Saprospira grandis DSM 2844]